MNFSHLSVLIDIAEINGTALQNFVSLYAQFTVYTFRFPVPGSLFPVPCSLFPVPCSRFPVPGSRFTAHG